jgi:hypothetical protein
LIGIASSDIIFQWLNQLEFRTKGNWKEKIRRNRRDVKKKKEE